MAGKTGKKPTGRKPRSVRRPSALADSASGRENVDRVAGKRRATRLDKAVSKRLKTGGAGA